MCISIQGIVIRVHYLQTSIALESEEERIHSRVFLCWKIIRDSLLVQLHHYLLPLGFLLQTFYPHWKIGIFPYFKAILPDANSEDLFYKGVEEDGWWTGRGKPKYSCDFRENFTKGI